MNDELKKIADQADVIVCGYSFTKTPDNIRILNLNSPNKAAVTDLTGQLLETNMDDIELRIVLDYLQDSLKYMGDQ